MRGAVGRVGSVLLARTLVPARDLLGKSCRCRGQATKQSQIYDPKSIMHAEEIKQRKIILFDGVCNLCNGSVIFILHREKEPIFKFASIQSEAGKELLEWCGFPQDFNQAVVLLDYGNIYLGSTAALKIGQQLKFPWSLLSCTGFIVPKLLRDWVYSQIAQHRYGWFGKRDVCMVPTQALMARFL